VVITGGNSGIGLQTAIELSKRGATVIIGPRDKSRGEAATISPPSVTLNTPCVLCKKSGGVGVQCSKCGKWMHRDCCALLLSSFCPWCVPSGANKV